ncbi:ABC transporter permease [Anaerocolumna sp. MB42-C2]|uniref:ABC transporter permease n=1 Tax=Anaerocolumna sp. MB42-C2 TaxID=3070997 RepID=UPI0027DEF5FB|nr:ABC transporter permease [Anaerocolumna sp. MB42-C2]WMJ85883.1 ABC transporter permease [Anaerocolumna sp. MB42-C2]
MAENSKPKRAGKKKFTWINTLQILTLIGLLAYMQYAVDHGLVLKVFMASPTSIIRKGYQMIVDGTLAPHFILTMQEVTVGYLLSAFVGIAIGLLWTIFPKLEEYMNVFCSAIMAVPKTAILPLLILWFGIGFKSKVVLIFLFSVFQILYNTVGGAKQCRTEYLKVARVFEASRLQTVFMVIIPAALPSVFTGLRLAAATALTGVVFSEMQSAKAGLGYLLTEAQNLLNTPVMFFIIILVTVISVLLVKLVTVIEYAICHKWRRV